MEPIIGVFNFLFTSYFGGVLFIIYGILYLKYERKRKQNINDLFFLRGWFSAVGSLIFGVLIIILNLLDKL